jgi:AraC-like DNA-binding protein
MDPIQITAIQAMQDYIESHLLEPISLHQLAKASGYSPYHAAHLFTQALGISPLAYWRKCRLSAAALRLRDHPDPILSIALEYQFDSHEGFTRAFASQFGMSPSMYRKLSPPIPIFRPYRYGPIRPQGVSPMTESTPIFIQLIQRPARACIVRRATTADDYFAYCDEVGCDVWGILCSVKEALGEPMGMWLPDAFRPSGTSEYVQGVEVPADYTKPLPEGFELLQLPAQTFMVFQGEPYDDEHYGDAIENLQAAIENYDPSITGYRKDPQGIRFQLEPRGERGYIEGLAVLPNA